MNLSKSSLAILLSKLKKFESPSAMREQYATDSEVAATVLWDASMKGDIAGKTVADLGCGTGILGIGCLMLGAAHVAFVDADAEALNMAEENLKQAESQLKIRFRGKHSFACKDISEFHERVDTVIQNPPFGTKDKGADLMFLGKAMAIAQTVYSFHKLSTLDYLKRHIAKQGFMLTESTGFNYPLAQTMRFHKKRIQRIEAVWLRIQKHGDKLYK